MARFLSLLVLTLLTGCQTSPQTKASDHAACTEIGAQPGTDAYVRCRLAKEQLHEARRQRVGAAISAAANSYKPPPPPRTTTCTTMRLGTMLQTTCN